MQHSLRWFGAVAGLVLGVAGFVACSSSSSSTPGGGSCGAGGSAECQTCTSNSCGSQLAACENAAACADYVSCLNSNNCTASACQDKFTTACQTACSDVGNCIAANCLSACSTAPTDSGTTQETGGQTCGTCAATSCGTELSTCQGDTQCNADITCLNNCAGDSNCANTCISNECGPDGGTTCDPTSTDFDALTACLGQNCGASCFGASQ